MFCSQCGSLVEENNNYCQKCGNKIKEGQKEIIKEEDKGEKIGKNYVDTLEEIIGKNKEYYIEEFRKIEKGEETKFNPIALILGLWMPYRKMYKEICIVFIPFIGIFYGAYLYIRGICGLNKMYYTSIIRKLERNGLTGVSYKMSNNEIRRRIKKIGGTSIGAVVGYVLVQLVIVAMVIKITMGMFLLGVTVSLEEAFTGEVYEQQVEVTDIRESISDNSKIELEQVDSNNIENQQDDQIKVEQVEVVSNDAQNTKNNLKEEESKNYFDFYGIEEYKFPNSHLIFEYLEEVGIEYVDEYDNENDFGIVSLYGEGYIGEFQYDVLPKTMAITSMSINEGAAYKGIKVGKTTVKEAVDILGEPIYQGESQTSGNYSAIYLYENGTSLFVEGLTQEENTVVQMITILYDPFMQ